MRGYSQWDVAEELQIDQSTVSRDTQYLKQQAQDSLKESINSHIQDKIPQEYHRCLTDKSGIKVKMADC